MLQPAAGALGTSTVPLVINRDPTDEEQNAPLPVITAATSDAPTTSYRATGSSQQRRANNLVLFVKPNDNESEAASRVPTLTSRPPPGQDSSNGRRGLGDSGKDSVEGDVGDDGDGGGSTEDGEQPGILSLVISASSSALNSVEGVATGAARKPLVTTALVLLYFILLDIVLLNDNERLNRVLRRTRASDGDALILLSTNLVRQLTDARRELEDAMQAHTSSLTMKGLEPALHKVQALERVCNHSITSLHTKLMFPGSVEDLLFLITEHATFDDRLRDLAVQELQWESTVSAAHTADAGGDLTHPTTPDKAGPTAPTAGAGDGTAAAAAEEAADPTTGSNPLRHVRLQRIVNDAQSAKEAAAARAKRAKGATAGARRRAREQFGLAVEAADVEETAAGLLHIVKNRWVAFLIICVLLSAVLRMG